MHPKNPEAGYLFGRRHILKVCKGARYLGGYIRDEIYKGDWLKKRTDEWEIDIIVIRKTADKYY